MTVLSDAEGEGSDEKYEIVRSSGPMMSSSEVAVEFVITAESLRQLRVVQRDNTQVCSTAQQQDHHDVNSCVDEPTGSVVTTTH